MFWILRFLVKMCIKICSLVANKMNSERVGSDWLCVKRHKWGYILKNSMERKRQWDIKITYSFLVIKVSACLCDTLFEVVGVRLGWFVKVILTKIT